MNQIHIPPPYFFKVHFTSVASAPKSSVVPSVFPGIITLTLRLCSTCTAHRPSARFNLLMPTVTRCTNSLTFNNCTFCPHCIYVFCIYLRTNSDLCHLQHKLIGFYNRDEKCLLLGTNWVFKYSSLRFVFKGLKVRGLRANKSKML